MASDAKRWVGHGHGNAAEVYEGDRLLARFFAHGSDDLAAMDARAQEFADVPTLRSDLARAREERDAALNVARHYEETVCLENAPRLLQEGGMAKAIDTVKLRDLFARAASLESALRACMGALRERASLSVHDECTHYECEQRRKAKAALTAATEALDAR